MTENLTAEPAPGFSDAELVALVQSASRAKRAVSQLYASWRDRAPGTASLMVARLAEDEAAHALLLDGWLTTHGHTPGASVVPTAVGCGVNDEAWPSSLMFAFALDQAITGALIALGEVPEPELARLAQRIVHEEHPHQTFGIESLRTFTRQDPALGRRLAREMLEARDWVQQLFPRRKTLGSLADAGLLPPTAPKAHDTFLASLGDKMQDALGVLGEF
jgi:1,2-phenylacetyl-CoA epoxidase catalytic subunit